MKNILKKLHDIMSEVDFIQKDKTNDFHGYNYASEQAIKGKLHGLLVKNKVIFTLSSVGSPMFSGYSVTTKKDGTMVEQKDTITHITFAYRFYDVESGEFIEGSFPGSGEDKLDKGTYKAITGAIKYILTSTFLIPTGDDPENEGKKPQVPSKTDQIQNSPANVIPPDHLIDCPCGSPRKYQKAGISKAGKPYDGFYPCSQRGCKNKSISAEDADQYLKPEYKTTTLEKNVRAIFSDGSPLPQPQF